MGSRTGSSSQSPLRIHINLFLSHVSSCPWKLDFPDPIWESKAKRLSPENSAYGKLWLLNDRNWRVALECQETEAFSCFWMLSCYYWRKGHYGSMMSSRRETITRTAVPLIGTKLSRHLSPGKEGMERKRPWWNSPILFPEFSVLYLTRHPTWTSPHEYPKETQIWEA